MHLKVACVKWRPFCLSLNVLTMKHTLQDILAVSAARDENFVKYHFHFSIYIYMYIFLYVCDLMTVASTIHAT